jgi:hypothetical protein
MIARDLLGALGLGQYAANMIIPYMMIAPATTDPKASQIILLVEAIQKRLYAMGARDVALTGHLDPPTARALRQVAGQNWERMSWGANVQALLAAGGRRLTARTSPTAPAAPSMPVAVAGPLDFLPDVPGGIVTYGVVGYLLYRHFTKRKG